MRFHPSKIHAFLVCTAVTVFAALSIGPVPASATTGPHPSPRLSGRSLDIAAMLGVLRAHAATAHTAPAHVASAGVRAAGTGGASAAAASCYGTTHSLPAGAASQLDVVSFGLLYDCTQHVWSLELTTSDSWAASVLDVAVAYFNTDGSSSTGCNGYDRAVLGTYDPSAGLVAGTFVTPSCNTSSFIEADEGEDVLTKPAGNSLRMQFTNDNLGNPSSFRWHGILKGTSETTPDVYPHAGDLTEAGFPPVPAGNPCPVVTTAGGQTGRMALVPDEGKARAAVVALQRAGLRSLTVRPGGVIRFTGDPTVAAHALGQAGLEAQVGTDRLAHYDDVPNDPNYPSQWNLPIINAPAAWSISHGSADVPVVDIDSGVDATHPDLQGKILPGFDETTGTTLAGGNTDKIGHGTAVAGVIAAATNNGLDLAGVGWDTTVVPVKLSDNPQLSEIDSAILWAADNGYKIVNLSLGGCNDPAEAAAVSTAQSKGVLLVAAAGNEFLNGNEPSYPAAYPGVIGVGATDHAGNRSFFSNTGSYVSLVAPGGSADGTASDDLPLLAPGGGLATGAGTSFSSPQVAAVAALILAADRSLTPSDAGALIVATAAPIGTSPDVNFGHGMLDAGRALSEAAKLQRAEGPDRYGTAVEVSKLGWPTGSLTVYVASGATFADALPAGALAGVTGGPVLLTAPCALPAETATELTRLSPHDVFIVGGTTAVCPAVAAAVQQVTGITPVRLAGADRYGTDAQIVDKGWPGTTPTVYVTTGVNFPDGLTGSARAAKDGAPLLLTQTCTLPASIQAELARLAPSTVKVIGGTLAICPAVVTAIQGVAKGATVTRIAGPDRVATAVAVVNDGWTQSTSAIVASAANFPDALSAGAYAALTKQPLLINDACATDPTVAQTLTALGAAHLTAVGGPVALCGAAVAPLVVALS